MFKSDVNGAGIYAEQVRYMFRHFIPPLLGSLLAALALLLLQWQVVEHRHLLYWLVLFVLVLTHRAVFIFRFNRQSVKDADCRQWGEKFFYSSAICGLVWALGVYVAYPADDLTHQLTLVLIVIGIGAGSIATIPILLNSFLAYVVPMFIVLMTLFVVENKFNEYVIAASLFMAMMFIVRGGFAVYRNNINNLRLTIDLERRNKELEKAWSAGEKANRAKSKFLSNMSHEIRTPLHGILSFSQLGLALGEDITSDKAMKYFSRIDSSGQRLKVLLDELLRLSKLEAGTLPLQFKPVMLVQLVKDEIDTHSQSLKQRDINLEYKFDENFPTVICDAELIGQAVHNVLSNAIKFSPEHGQIQVLLQKTANTDSSGDEDEIVKISVIDQGPGIVESEIETIFSQYIQGNKQNIYNEGSGLGLAICWNILQAHDGRIWCENGPLQGAIFHIEFPVRTALSESPDSRV